MVVGIPAWVKPIRHNGYKDSVISKDNKLFFFDDTLGGEKIV